MQSWRSRRPRDPDEVRMTIGEHLEELRACLIRGLAALLIACLACIWPARYLLELLARPVVLVLQHENLNRTLLATGPVEVLVIYIKVVLFSGLVIAAPYILYQLWSFVAAGLYPHERRWVYRLAPISIGLFLAGIAFMYTFVLLVSLKFLVGLATWIPLPRPTPTLYERLVLGGPGQAAPATQPADAGLPRVAVLDRDPVEAPPGTIWFNRTDHELKLRGSDRTYSTPLVPVQGRGLVAPHFRLGEYINFVMILGLAFGLAFQMPLVVVFLVRAGLVSVATLASYRKVVILIIVFVAGILAPPDLMSHLLLSGPMILLFELGLWLARRRDRPAAPSP